MEPQAQTLSKILMTALLTVILTVSGQLDLRQNLTRTLPSSPTHHIQSVLRGGVPLCGRTSLICAAAVAHPRKRRHGASGAQEHHEVAIGGPARHP